MEMWAHSGKGHALYYFSIFGRNIPLFSSYNSLTRLGLPLLANSMPQLPLMYFYLNV